jgi:hypothetical protein
MLCSCIHSTCIFPRVIVGCLVVYSNSKVLVMRTYTVRETRFSRPALPNEQWNNDSLRYGTLRESKTKQHELYQEHVIILLWLNLVQRKRFGIGKWHVFAFFVDTMKHFEIAQLHSGTVLTKDRVGAIGKTLIVRSELTPRQTRIGL